MPELCHTPGVVIRARRDKDVLLTLLTPTLGRISVIAKGARSLKGPQMSLSQVFCYGDYELYRRGEIYWLRTGELKDNFYGVAQRLDALNLASYFCDVASLASEPDVPAAELMRLLLNCLAFLERETYPDLLIKGVFEWRVLAMQGLSPSLGSCPRCGRRVEDICAAFPTENFTLDIAQGALLCGKCRGGQVGALSCVGNIPGASASEAVLLSADALAAIRFALRTPMERMMSFRMENPEDIRMFSVAGEKFLRYHMDCDSKALSMYYAMKI